MGTGPLRRWGGYIFIAVAAAVVLSSLFLLARSAENHANFDDWQQWIIGINAGLVLVMAALLARRLFKLVRDYRRKLPGSRLTLRTVAVFSALVIVPLLVIYSFAWHFLNKSIDSWFKGELNPQITEAGAKLSEALDIRAQEQVRQTVTLAQLPQLRPGAQLAAALDAERAGTGSRDMMVFNASGEVLAASYATGQSLLGTGDPARGAGEGRQR